MSNVGGAEALVEIDARVRKDVRRPRRLRARAPLADPRTIEIPIPQGFLTELGDSLPDRSFLVRLSGRRFAPVVVVMGGISAGRIVCGPNGWWREVVGETRAIDLQRYGVLGLDFAPIENARVRMSPRTQARLLACALDFLGIERIEAIVGASYGAMVGLAFAAMAPQRLNRLCVISAAHRPWPLASAWRGVQRRVVEFALEQNRGEDGIALARQLAMTTYRSGEEFEARFHGLMGHDGRSDIDRYLIARGVDYGSTMGAKRWLSLSEAIDRFSVAPASVLAPTTLIGCPSDQIVPMGEMRELARLLPNLVALHELSSIYGHDAFLKEHGQLSDMIRSCLEGEL